MLLLAASCDSGSSLEFAKFCRDSAAMASLFRASLFQKIALSVYRRSTVRWLMHTSLGSNFFIWCYDRYKDAIEVPENRALARRIPPKRWIIDVGANIGFFTERFARAVSGGGRVIAIEPDSQNLDMLRKRLKRHGLGTVDICQAVANARSGPVRFLKNPEHLGDHRIDGKGEEVEGITIDGLIEQAGNPDVALVKIDAQGAEPAVLAGAVNTLTRCKADIFIEVDDQALRQGGTTAEILLNQLQISRYRLFRLSRAGSLTSLSTEQALQSLADDGRGYIDLLCVHQDRL